MRNFTRPLRSQLKAMEQLQELDLKIDQLKRGCGELPLTLRELDQKVAKAQSELTARTLVLTELEKNVRQNGAAQEMNRDRIARSAAKLESVANSQEYQAATKEMDQLKKLETTLVEQAAQLEAEISKTKTECDTISARLQESTKEKEEMAAKVGSQVSELNSKLESLHSERVPFVDQIDKPILVQYDRIRGARGGLGLVPSVGGRCKGCNMVVAPQMNNELVRGDVFHQCPSCFRILYIPAPAGT